MSYRALAYLVFAPIGTTMEQAKKMKKYAFIIETDNIIPPIGKFISLAPAYDTPLLLVDYIPTEDRADIPEYVSKDNGNFYTQSWLDNHPEDNNDSIIRLKTIKL